MQAFADPETVIARYLAGESMAAIGQSFGVSRQTVHQLLRKHGVGIADRHRVFDARVCELVSEWLSQSEIARTLSCSDRRVLASVRRQGLPPATGRALTDAQIANVVERYVEGEPISRLAAANGVMRGTIERYVDAAGVREWRAPWTDPRE